ncbi:DnaD domain protein [Weissella soli]|uniref:DnaD domain protein n=1 Tax=Weissella soli TaxID=155866 RepID=UPI001F381BC2|nr:DnaD domain protein [Weissella soli]GJM47813.1 helicase DnaB [Weissella soli]
MAFHTNQHYRVIIPTEPLTQTHTQALAQLYLPIIGPEAFAVYFSMVTGKVSDEPTLNHTDLLDQLAISSPHFLQAREMLEGLGLLKSFEQKLTTTTQWVYQFFLPLTPSAFFHEKLLLGLLNHYIGTEQTTDLVGRLLPHTAEIPGQDVSKHFFDVIRHQQMADLDIVVPENRITSPLVDALGASNTSIDFELIQAMLKSFQVQLVELKRHESNLLLIKDLYGVSDTDLARVIGQNLNNDKSVNIKGVEQSFARNYRASFNTPRHASQPAETISGDTDDNPLIAAAKKLSPLEFLGDIRKQSGGMVTSGEEFEIKKLVQLGKLPNVVLNIMLYNLTIVEQRTTLSQAFMETVYNDWAQVGIQTPEAAIKYLQERQVKKQQTTQKRGGTHYQTTPRVIEKRPDWQKQQARTLSSDEKQAADQMLAELQARRNQNEGEN